MTPIALIVIALVTLTVAFVASHLGNLKRDRVIEDLQKTQKQNEGGIAMLQNDQRALRNTVEHWEEGRYKKGYDLGKEHGKALGREDLRKEWDVEDEKRRSQAKDDLKEHAEMLAKFLNAPEAAKAEDKPADKKAGGKR